MYGVTRSGRGRYRSSVMLGKVKGIDITLCDGEDCCRLFYRGC